jgi:hypothetical protein
MRRLTNLLWDSEATQHKQWKVTTAQEPKPEHKPKENQKLFLNSKFLKRRSPLQVSVRLLL